MRSPPPPPVPSPCPPPLPVQVTVHTDNMDMAGEMVTDLAGYLGITDLSSTADFPRAMEEFKGVLEKV